MIDYSGTLQRNLSGIDQGLNTAGQLQGLQMGNQQLNMMKQQSQQKQQAQQQAQAQAQQKQAAMQEGALLLKDGTAEEVSQFMFKNPDIKKQFIEAANFKNGARMSSRVDFAKDVVSGQVEPIQAAQEMVKEIEAAGGDATGLKKALESGDPEVIRTMAEKDLAMLDNDAFKSYQESMGIAKGKPMSEYEGLMIENRKADHKISILKIQQANAKTELQNDKLQQEIDKLQAIKEKNEKTAQDEEVDLEFEYKTLKDEAGDMLTLIGRIKNHKGLDSAVGMKGFTSLGGFLDSPMSGSAGADVVALIENLEAKNFMAGVQKFKEKGGSGSLSDNEGKQLAAELANLSRAQSVGAFMETLENIESLVKRSTRRQEEKIAKKKGLSSGISTEDADSFLDGLGF